jgi:hypothetical protein
MAWHFRTLTRPNFVPFTVHLSILEHLAATYEVLLENKEANDTQHVDNVLEPTRTTNFVAPSFFIDPFHHKIISWDCVDAQITDR